MASCVGELRGGRGDVGTVCVMAASRGGMLGGGRRDVGVLEWEFDDKFWERSNACDGCGRECEEELVVENVEEGLTRDDSVNDGDGERQKFGSDSESTSSGK